MDIKYIDRKSGELKTEHPPSRSLLNFLYHNKVGNKTILPMARRKFISHFYGHRMNRSSSVKKIKPFVKSLGIDLSDSEKSLEEFTSFNDFFYRKLKPTARKIQAGLVSPGDGRLLAFESVSEVNQFYIKGYPFTLSAFLENHDLAKRFENHQLIILRLAPNDYHRYHFPYAGTPTAITKIKGRYYSVSPIALIKNFARVFCENKREYCILNTAAHGQILVAPVGATMVGSMISTYTPNQPVEKGDEMGYFAFGGSTVVLLVEKHSFKIDDDLITNTQNHLETLVQMGESIGKAIP